MSCFFCSDEWKDYYKEIIELDQSYVYLNNEQAYLGRCAVVTKKHYTELYQLSKEELSVYMQEVAMVANTVANAFSADKINYSICGDIDSHIHFHIVPKKRGGKDWGRQFEMSGKEGEQVFLTEDEYQSVIAGIRKYICLKP